MLLGCAIFLGSGLTGFSQTTNSFFQFVQSQGERHYTRVPHEVLAFYYGWYGKPEYHSWGDVDTNKPATSKTARYPFKGAYSSHDPEVLDWQIDQAKAHGVTGFIVSWWGQADWESWHDQSLALLLEHAERKNFKVSIYWEQAPGDGYRQIERAINELSYVLKKYGRSNSFLKVAGRPVIFAYGRVMAQIPASAWPEIIQQTRANAGDFALNVDSYQGSYSYLFDGMHSYALDGFPFEFEKNLADKFGDFRAWVAAYFNKGMKLARQRNRVFCAMVGPGYDARKAYKIDYQTDRLDGRTYRAMWEEAIKANPDWVLITSWNEWPEGTEIEPSLELGDKYLQITAEYSKRFLDRAPVDVPPAAPLPRFVPGTTRELDQVLSGRKIGVLMQDRMSDAEFWAAYCGATLQRLNWPDLIDPKVFNASNYPVLIHIGGEHYLSSVKVTDDVTLSLARYLSEGGFLVSLPTGTWPLLYDDSRKGVPHGITDALALGIDNGFEQPTNGIELTFYAKTNVLFGLPATAPFPGTGDLRWRPANRSRVPVSEIYVPLVQLKDGTGRPQGDAVCYIEHRTPSLAGGKSVYVWMRTAEAFGPDVFLPSLYQFISTRLKPIPADN